MVSNLSQITWRQEPVKLACADELQSLLPKKSCCAKPM